MVTLGHTGHGAGRILYMLATLWADKISRCGAKYSDDRTGIPADQIEVGLRALIPGQGRSCP